MLGYDTRQVGLMIAAVPVLLGVTAPIAGILSDKIGVRLIATIGLFIMLFVLYGLGIIEPHGVRP